MGLISSIIGTEEKYPSLGVSLLPEQLYFLLNWRSKFCTLALVQDYHTVYLPQRAMYSLFFLLLLSLLYDTGIQLLCTDYYAGVVFWDFFFLNTADALSPYL